jgi:putative hydrolase of the HAD superfamily
LIQNHSDIVSIVFDLDGTLYRNRELGGEIMAAAEDLISQCRGLTLQDTRKLLRSAKQALAETLDEEPTLTRSCQELGIDIRELHRAFQARIRPERYLNYDPVLQALLDSLRDHCALYIYTNNNLPITQKILALLGVEGLFDSLYTIEYRWQPKPDLETLQALMGEIGGPPESFLFVGDRRHVDLQQPEELGAATLELHDTAELLQVHKLLGILP